MSIEQVLKPTRDVLARARANGFYIRNQSLLDAELTNQTWKRDRDGDNIITQTLWRDLCKIEKRPCIYGRYHSYGLGTIQLTIPKRGTAPIQAWMGLIAVEHARYDYGKLGYSTGVSYRELNIPGPSIPDIWFNGFVKFAQTEWKEILKPLSD